MTASIRLQIDSDLDKVALVGRAVRALCADILGEEGADAVELSLVEAINNVIKHGYHGEAGQDVQILVGLSADEVVLELIDHATPLQASLLDQASDEKFAFDETNVAELPEGGMGLALIRMNMDQVEYRSAGGENHLWMTKRAATDISSAALP